MSDKILVVVTDLGGDPLAEIVKPDMTNSYTAQEFGALLGLSGLAADGIETGEEFGVTFKFKYMTQEEIDALPDWAG